MKTITVSARAWSLSQKGGAEAERLARKVLHRENTTPSAQLDVWSDACWQDDIQQAAHLEQADPRLMRAAATIIFTRLLQEAAELELVELIHNGHTAFAKQMLNTQPYNS